MRKYIFDKISVGKIKIFEGKTHTLFFNPPFKIILIFVHMVIKYAYMFTLFKIMNDTPFRIRSIILNTKS